MNTKWQHRNLETLVFLLSFQCELQRIDFDEAVSSIQGSKHIPTVSAVRILLRKLLFFYSNSKDAQRLVRKYLAFYILHTPGSTVSIMCYGDTVALWLGHRTPAQVVQVQALAGNIVLCSWARHCTLIVPLSTQLYKCILANLMLRLTL